MLHGLVIWFPVIGYFTRSADGDRVTDGSVDARVGGRTSLLLIHDTQRLHVAASAVYIFVALPKRTEQPYTLPRTIVNGRTADR